MAQRHQHREFDDSQPKTGRRRFSDQESRDRLRSRRRDSSSHSGSAQRRASRSDRHQADRYQGASANQPELRLRAPRKTRSTSPITAGVVGAKSAERSKVAERERAAGRPGSTSADTYSVKPERSRSALRTRTSTGSGSRSSVRLGKSSSQSVESAVLGAGSAQQPANGSKGSRTSDKKTKRQRETDRKQKARQREQRERFLKRTGIAAVSVLAIALAVWGIGTFLNSSIFFPHEVEVQGVRFIGEDNIRQLAAIDMQSSTITMDTTAIEERLEENTWVAQATVSTYFPRTVFIDIVERTPAVVLEVDDVYWVASSDGKWLGTTDEDATTIIDPTGSVAPANVEALTIFPVEGIVDPDPEWGGTITNDSLQNVLAHLRGLDVRIVSTVQRISAPEIGRTSFFTVDGVELDLGRADNIDEKSTIILNMLEEHGDSVVLINVRSIENPTLRRLP